MTVREEVIIRLLLIVEWTMEGGRLKSADHSTPKRLAEQALEILEPALDREHRDPS